MSEANKKTVKCTRSVIKTCEYGRIAAGECVYCDYITKTGHRRGCKPECCDKYEKKKRK